VKDLASLKTNDSLLKQIHSISKCETDTMKSSTSKKNSQINSSTFFSFSPVPGPDNLSKQKTTLNLSLSEAGHIRSVLARAELEV
jgi:hypothetical protein